MAGGKRARSAPRTAAALGFRAHSGWATLVVVGGSPRSPAVLDRRRIELADPTVPGAKQPYHAAAELDLNAAALLVKRCASTARLLARRALRKVIGEHEKKAHRIVGCGILLGSGRTAASLAATLASHPMIHTAEGELFRKVLIDASRRHGLPVTGVRERELYARAATQLHLRVGELARRATELGRAIGPPWRQDEKHAALVAWLALSGPSSR